MKRLFRPLFFFALVALFITAAANSAINQTELVTGPGTCFSNAECPADSFCNYASWFNPLTNHCFKKLRPGAACPAYDDVCVPGYECQFRFSDSKALCRLLTSTAGEACTVDGPSIRTCATGERCAPSTSDPSKYVCMAGRGRKGDACRWDDDCDQDGGFYCKGEKTCRPKVGPGALCTNRADNYHCSGFCATSPTFPYRQVCFAQLQEGGRCTEDRHCFNEFYTRNPAGRMLCNMPRDAESGTPGVCVREARLLKTLGAKCDPKADLCDGRRGLSCKWASGSALDGGKRGKFVCQQFSTRDNLYYNNYCTPGHPLSPCKVTARGIPAECAVPQNGAFFGDEQPRFYQCVHKLSIMRQGQICNKFVEVKCEAGTTCEYVHGVKHLPCNNRFCDTSLRFCVAAKRLGQRCTKFKHGCGKGNACVNGKCTKLSRFGFTGDSTHAGLGVNCTTLPCAPGLACQGAGADRKCGKPVVRVGEGKRCFELPRYRRQCPDSMKCLQNANGFGIPRCRRPHRQGAICSNNDDCAGSLRCSYSTAKQRCYNPAKALKIGERCTPPTKNQVNPCREWLECLPAAGGHKCQNSATLFEPCVTNNTACFTPKLVTCSESGSCIPRPV